MKWTGSTWQTMGKTLVQLDVSLSSSESLQVVGIDSSSKGWTYVPFISSFLLSLKNNEN